MLYFSLNISFGYVNVTLLIRRLLQIHLPSNDHSGCYIQSPIEQIQAIVNQIGN